MSNLHDLEAICGPVEWEQQEPASGMVRHRLVPFLNILPENAGRWATELLDHAGNWVWGGLAHDHTALCLRRDHVRRWLEERGISVMRSGSEYIVGKVPTDYLDGELLSADGTWTSDDIGKFATYDDALFAAAQAAGKERQHGMG